MADTDRRGLTRNALKLHEGRRVNVYLDAESLKIAQDLGGNNTSEGIRRALKMASPRRI